MKDGTFFIIPGFKQKATDKQLVWLVNLLKERNFKVVAVPIKWDRRVMSNYIKDFQVIYNKEKTSINYVLGFSYGAVIVFSTASELEPKKIFLCSLSPDFKEDLNQMKPWIKRLVGKRRIEDINKRSAVKMAKELKIPVVIFYGEEEGKKFPALKKRAEETAKLATKAKLVIVESSPHLLNFPEYKKAIEKELPR